MAEMRLVVAGAGGRMGRTLVKAIADSKGFCAGRRAGRRALAADRLGRRHAGRHAENGVKLTGDAAALMDKADGIIDFTAPAATVAFAALAAKAGKVHIIGTTGLSAADEAKIKDAAKTAVIVKSGNMSLGVNLLAALTRRVAKTLDNSFDIEILEMHHNQKVDAPSGTALMLGRAAAEGRGIDLDKHSVKSARRPHRRAQGRRHRLCGAARRQRGRRAQRDLRRPGRAPRTRAQGRGPHDLRARRAARRAVGARPEAGALFDGRRARPWRISDGGDMTPEQVTQRKSWVYALIGAGIAVLVVAYQYAISTSSEGITPPIVPIGFAGLGVVFFIVAGFLALKLNKDPTPAATTDFSAPGGKTVKVLMVIGFAAMAGTWLVGYVTPEKEPLGLTLSVILLVIGAVCLISAGRIARRIRNASATGAAKK